MNEDVFREGKDEIVESSEVRKGIGRKTAFLYKNKINKLNEVK